MDEKKIRENYRKLTLALIEKGLTITTMESATSGQIASLITDTEGSSAIFHGAFVTYCNEEKIKRGVPAEIIEKYSVYSEETARAMAEAVRRAIPSDLAIGVTGTMGNVDPANAQASCPGKVYFAIVLEGKTYSYQTDIPVQDSRLDYKLLVAEKIYEKIIFLL